MAAATAGGGSAVEKISVRAVLIRYLAIGVSQQHVGAVGAERLAERPDDHVDLVLEPGSATEPAPAGPDAAGAVGLVDHHARVVALRQLDDLGQRRDVAVHREDAVGHDQRAAALGLRAAPTRGGRGRSGRRRTSRPARAGSRRRSMAWLSASEKTTSPSRASAETTPVLAR